MLPASAALAVRGHLRSGKFPCLQVCLLVLQAFSSLCQSVVGGNTLRHYRRYGSENGVSSWQKRGNSAKNRSSSARQFSLRKRFCRFLTAGNFAKQRSFHANRACVRASSSVCRFASLSCRRCQSVAFGNILQAARRSFRYFSNVTTCTCGGTPTRRLRRLMPMPLETIVLTPPSMHSPLIHSWPLGSNMRA